MLFEAAPDPGGQVLIGAGPLWRRDFRGIVDWRVGEIGRLGVTLRTNTMAGPDGVTALDPDFVIVATGGVPDLDWIEGAEHRTSARDPLAGQVQPGRSVVVYDGTGRHPGPHAAVRAAGAGAEVTFASLDGQLGPELT